jgi:predicted RNase H-like HicB family nuclease
MELNKYTIIINKDEDGWFIADVPALISCHTQAKPGKRLWRISRM